MFLPAHYNCTDIRAVGMFRSQFGVSVLQSAGEAAAAGVQVARINKNTLNYNYQSTMALLVIHFTYLGGMLNWW
jgi:hypothetical protein